MTDSERMRQLYGNLKLEKIRQAIWRERLILFPIKLVVAYFVYHYLDHGTFYILGYLLFCVGEQSARLYVSTHELNETIKNTHQTLLGEIINK